MGFASLEPAPIDHDHDNGSATLTHGAAESTVISRRTKVGKSGKIVSVRQAWDSGIDYAASTGGAYWELRINGVPHSKYLYSNIQLAPPEASDYRLPVPIPVEQNALVEVIMKNTHSANDGAGYAVLDIYYYPQE